MEMNAIIDKNNLLNTSSELTSGTKEEGSFGSNSFMISKGTWNQRH